MYLSIFCFIEVPNVEIHLNHATSQLVFLFNRNVHILTRQIHEMNKRVFIAINLLLFIFLLLILPHKAHDSDMGFWRNWASLIYEQGFTKIYLQDNVNYHPLFLYMLKLYDVFYHNNDAIWVNIGHVKFFSLLFDFMGLYAVKLVMDKFQIALHHSFYLILNIAYLYNSFMWGQVDSIYTNLTVIAICLMLLEKPVASILFFVLAINAKMQAIFFVPILGILWLNQFELKKAIVAIIAGIVLQFLIIAPFVYGHSLGGLINVVKGAEDFYPVISMNAHNMWCWIYPHGANLTGISDKEIYLGVSMKQYGKVLFLISCFACLWPMLLLYLKKALPMNESSTWQIVFLASILVTVSFFYFNTQMHERYSHPMIICSFIYGLLSRHFALYILSSIAYLLNLEKVLHFFNLQYQTLIFEPRLISFLYFIILSIAFYRFFKLYQLQMALIKAN
jgi:Gpi18-like mannosyltransferase